MRQFCKKTFEEISKCDMLHNNPLYGVIVYEVDADGIDCTGGDSDDMIADAMDAPYYNGYGYVFKEKSVAKEFILQSANKYADSFKDSFASDTDKIEFIELPDDNFIAIGGSSYCKIYKITTMLNIDHRNYDCAKI